MPRGLAGVLWAAMSPRLRSLLALAVPSIVAAACGPNPQPPSAPPPPSPAVTADAAVQARQCTPWSEPAPEAPPAGEPGELAGRRAQPLKKGDLCETADSNLARTEAKILADPGGPMASHAAWNHTRKPEYMDRVARRLAFTRTERDLVAKNGFAVLSRINYSTYAWALHEIYQSELPIYISADSILHAVYASNDHLLADIEARNLVGLLGRTLSAMHCALGEASYPPEVARDLDLYLTVARSLLADRAVPGVLGTDEEAAALVAAARKAQGMASLELFGRSRLIDWSQFLPRGHYADPVSEPDGSGSPPPGGESGRPSLAPYFRAGMWLARLEMNLVSRSSRSSLHGDPDPRETPREAICALALADLAERARVHDDVRRLDRAWTLLAGRREDVSIADMLKLRHKAHIGKIELGSFDALKEAIGNDFQRTARLHPMPEGAAVLPAIATFLGPRVVADAAAFRPLVHTEVDQRYLVGAGDVAYVLGLDRGKAHLQGDLARYPSLGQKLDQARASLARAPDAGDLYGAWLGAVRGVARPPSGVVPSFMQTPAYDDLRVNTLVAGYGQIRHNYVLMAGQAYDEGGCEIPDGWVEPLPAVYEGLVKYAQRGAAVMKELDPGDELGAGAYFAELEKIARLLGVVARHELDGRALTLEEKRFLSMVVEMSPGGTGGPPTYTGWYFDLFRGRAAEALADAGFVADYYTSSWQEKVVYAGAAGPRMGVFVVDAGGPPRVMVGPVAHAYEVVGPLDRRYTDASVAKAEGKQEPWSASYTAPAPLAPALALAASFPPESKKISILVRARSPLSHVTIEALDHHRVPIAQVTRAFSAGAAVRLSLTPPRSASGLRVRIGEFTAEGFISGPSTTASFELGGEALESGDWELLSK